MRLDRTRLAPAPGRAPRPHASCRAAARPRCRPPALVELLAEHLHARADRLLHRVLQAHDLDLVVHLDDAALDATWSPPCRGPRSRTRPPTGIRNASITARSGTGMYLSISSTSFTTAGTPISLFVALERLQRRALHDRVLSPGEVVLRQQLADFHLDELRVSSGRRPCPPCSGTPRCRARPPAAPAGCARASAASGRRRPSTTRIAPSICAAPVIMFFT